MDHKLYYWTNCTTQYKRYMLREKLSASTSFVQVKVERKGKKGRLSSLSSFAEPFRYSACRLLFFMSLVPLPTSRLPTSICASTSSSLEAMQRPLRASPHFLRPRGRCPSPSLTSSSASVSYPSTAPSSVHAIRSRPQPEKR